MKTTMFKKALLMLVLIIGTMIAFSSCSNDSDNDNDETSLLIGTWVNTNDAKDELTIGSNGSWYSVYDKNGRFEQIRKGTYSYDATSRTIIVSIQSGSGNGAYTMTIFVQSLTSTTLAMVSDSFGSKIYQKR